MNIASTLAAQAKTTVGDVVTNLPILGAVFRNSHPLGRTERCLVFELLDRDEDEGAGAVFADGGVEGQQTAPSRTVYMSGRSSDEIVCHSNVDFEIGFIDHPI